MRAIRNAAVCDLELERRQRNKKRKGPRHMGCRGGGSRWDAAAFCGLLLVLWVRAIAATAVEAASQGVWIEQEGMGCLGEVETRRELRERVLKETERRAMEEGVGAFIRASTTVYNAQVADDLVQKVVRGKIERREVLTEGWIDRPGEPCYQVKLKAYVVPLPGERLASFQVKVWLSRSQLQEGDEVTIYYTLSRDAYVALLSVAADGSVTVLIPSVLRRNNFARAGVTDAFPLGEERVKGIRLEARLLPGWSEAQARVKLIATESEEPWLTLGFQEGVQRVYHGKDTGLISDLIKKLSLLEPGTWEEATAMYTLARKP